MGGVFFLRRTGQLLIVLPYSELMTLHNFIVSLLISIIRKTVDFQILLLGIIDFLFQFLHHLSHKSRLALYWTYFFVCNRGWKDDESQVSITFVELLLNLDNIAKGFSLNSFLLYLKIRKHSLPNSCSWIYMGYNIGNQLMGFLIVSGTKDQVHKW